MRFFFPILACIFFLTYAVVTTIAAASDILIDTRLLDMESAESGARRDDLQAARALLRSDLSAGLYDIFDIELRTEDDGRIQVNAASFRVMATDLQNQVLDRLMEYHSERFVAVYEAWVDADENPLTANPFFRHIAVPTGLLAGDVPAQNLLSAYGRRWAYRMSDHDGPNCWHTAVASTNKSWQRHRYMNHHEFSCHLRTSYVQISPAREDLRFGDLISLVDHHGVPVHAFVYLGPDSKDPSRLIVFTKNGYMRSGFLFQDYDTVTKYIYPGNKVRFYRYARRAVDPSDTRDGDCRDEYTYDFTEFLRDKWDPVIVAGLRHTDPLLLAPIRIN